MKKLLMLFFAVGVLSACSDLNKEQQLKRIEQEQKRLDLLSEKIKDKRMDDVSAFKINTMQTELKIKQNLHLDTINMELAKQLNAYKVMYRSIQPLIKQFQQLKSGIKEEKQTLKLLNQDIKQGRGERHRFDEFIKFEHNKVEQLAALSTDYLRAKAQLFDDYYRLYPSVNALANQLVAKAERRR
jgi:replicative superfamily II helicase